MESNEKRIDDYPGFLIKNKMKINEDSSGNPIEPLTLYTLKFEDGILVEILRMTVIK